MDTLYLVYGDIYPNDNLCSIRIFGVFKTEDDAEKIAEEKRNEYFGEDQSVRFQIQVQPMTVGKITNVYLGDYLR